ncbi:hypothetical protein ACGYLO_16455 [Sulfitobacter sp. 1A13353]|uniref:hypothetical protein n=1 Tax=Sulfitobacter sp. 1A13353 TaxID=3368568 RepID=UPI00374709D4
MTTLTQALTDLNRAAYAANFAGRDTRQHPHLDRQTIREICEATDKLVDENAMQREGAA